MTPTARECHSSKQQQYRKTNFFNIVAAMNDKTEGSHTDIALYFNVEKQRGHGLAFFTKQDRPLLPLEPPPTRLARAVVPYSGLPHVGPSTYEKEELTNLKYVTDHRIVSVLGYTARTGPRLRKQKTGTGPSPFRYQKNVMTPKVFSPAPVPFMSKPEGVMSSKECYPGPGTYDHDVPKCRQVAWQQSFGSSPVFVPSLSKMSLIPASTQRLSSVVLEKKYLSKLAYLKLYYG